MTSPVMTNRTFDELKVGDSATIQRTVGREDIELFALASGDLQLLIRQTLPLSEAAAAHRALESGRTAGKLLLVP